MHAAQPLCVNPTNPSLLIQSRPQATLPCLHPLTPALPPSPPRLYLAAAATQNNLVNIKLITIGLRLSAVLMLAQPGQRSRSPRVFRACPVSGGDTAVLPGPARHRTLGRRRRAHVCVRVFELVLVCVYALPPRAASPPPGRPVRYQQYIMDPGR